MMPFACSGCSSKLTVRRNVTAKQVKCPRCGASTPVPQGRPEPMPLRSAQSPPPGATAPVFPPTTIPDDEFIPLPEEGEDARSTVETDFSEEPPPGSHLDEPESGELAGLGARLR